ncbi:phage tail protein [Pectinatus frisingensis]|uniref:phage tail protein n=1 Tax=Pectinatus frisingensis TaxID=865 RepID=UPI0018C72CCD|nr:phage tail protein [Pectinatus frisingensis]
MGIWDNLISIVSIAEKISGNIGTLGDLVFEVSSYDKIYTIDNYKRNSKSRTASHEVIGQKPILEFLGPDTDTISFTMRFNAFYGVNPTTETEKLRDYCSSGEVLQFTLGGNKVGNNKWIIDSVGETVNSFNGRGKVIVSTVDVSLKEYPENTGSDVNASN